MMELPNTFWEFQTDGEYLKHTIAKCLEFANQEEMCTIYIIYPSPYVLVDDFAKSFCYGLKLFLDSIKEPEITDSNFNTQKKIDLQVSIDHFSETSFIVTHCASLGFQYELI